MQITPSDIISVLSLISVFTLGLMQVKKNRAEARKLQAEALERESLVETNKSDAVSKSANASKTFAETAQMSAERYREAMQENTQLRTDLDILRMDFQAYKRQTDEKIELLIDERDALKDWAERLVKALSVAAPHVSIPQYVPVIK